MNSAFVFFSVYIFVTKYCHHQKVFSSIINPPKKPMVNEQKQSIASSANKLLDVGCYFLIWYNGPDGSVAAIIDSGLPLFKKVIGVNRIIKKHIPMLDKAVRSKINEGLVNPSLNMPSLCVSKYGLSKRQSKITRCFKRINKPVLS